MRLLCPVISDPGEEPSCCPFLQKEISAKKKINVAVLFQSDLPSLAQSSSGVGAGLLPEKVSLGNSMLQETLQSALPPPALDKTLSNKICWSLCSVQQGMVAVTGIAK